MNPPGEPSGHGTHAAWLRALLRFCIGNTLLEGPGYRKKQGNSGYTLDFTERAIVRPIAYHFKSMEDDYLVCRTWDGENEGDEDINISKPTKLRFSITSETIDSDAVSYSSYDTSTQTRNADDGSTSEDQVIVPRYLVNDVIYAIRCQTFVDDPDADPDSDPMPQLNLIDMNIDARAWMAT